MGGGGGRARREKALTLLERSLGERKKVPVRSLGLLGALWAAHKPCYGGQLGRKIARERRL